MRCGDNLLCEVQSNGPRVLMLLIIVPKCSCSINYVKKLSIRTNLIKIVIFFYL